MFTYEQDDKKCSALLKGELTIYQAAAFKDQLMAILHDKRALEIDLAQVTELDTAGVQLLMLAKITRESAGLPFSLTHHSAAVVNVFELLGLAGWFNDPIVIPHTADVGGNGI